tara:strand:+ start:43 stop:399 length:357 start_codon:yes stop_codon:yes gene_type:complete
LATGCRRCGQRFRWLKKGVDFRNNPVNIFRCNNCGTTVAFRILDTVGYHIQKTRIGFAKEELLHFKWFTKFCLRHFQEPEKPVEATWTMDSDEKKIAEQPFDFEEYKKNNCVTIEHND